MSAPTSEPQPNTVAGALGTMGLSGRLFTVVNLTANAVLVLLAVTFVLVFVRDARDAQKRFDEQRAEDRREHAANRQADRDHMDDIIRERDKTNTQIVALLVSHLDSIEKLLRELIAKKGDET